MQTQEVYSLPVRCDTHFNNEKEEIILVRITEDYEYKMLTVFFLLLY